MHLGGIYIYFGEMFISEDESDTLSYLLQTWNIVAHMSVDTMLHLPPGVYTAISSMYPQNALSSTNLMVHADLYRTSNTVAAGLQEYDWILSY